MSRKLVVISKVALAFLGLTLCILGSYLFSSTRFFTEGIIGITFQEVLVVCRNPETQWVVMLCAGIYLVTFTLLQSHHRSPCFWHISNPDLWLMSALLIAGFAYALNYSTSSRSLDVITLLTGAIAGKGAGTLVPWRSEIHRIKHSIAMIVILIISVLAFASLLHPNISSTFQYHGQTRWSGPWNNPNVCGLLMGTGIVLAIGMAVSSFKFQVFRESIAGSWKSGVKRYAVIIVCLFAAILMGRGLLNSYSRGAWLATICGLAYLANGVFSFQFSQATPRRAVFSQWLRRNGLLLAIIVLSLGSLAFWQFRDVEWHPARRAFSTGNINDLSWRNRVSAWEGALQITAEHPVLGAGWNQPESLYENYYLSPKLEESGAIGLNDYLMVGTTLGVPALICFITYIWLSLKQNSEVRRQKPEVGDRQDACPSLDIGHWTSDWLKTTCRAGAIVLLIGFWFDGELFNLPIVTVFWILLELGAARSTPAKIAVPS